MIIALRHARSCKKLLPILLAVTMVSVNGLAVKSVYADDKNKNTPRKVAAQMFDLDNLNCTYGYEADGTPFLQKPDGTRARYTSLTPQNLKIEIRKDRKIGTMEFRRIAQNNTITSFSAPNAKPFTVMTKAITAPSSQPQIEITMRYGSAKVSMKLDASTSLISRDAEKRLQHIVSALRADGRVKLLMEESSFFASRASMSSLLPVWMTSNSGLDCTHEAAGCIIAVAAYVGGIGAIVTACGATLGAGCVGILLVHPVLGVYVATSCTKAIQACGVGGKKEIEPSPILLEQ